MVEFLNEAEMLDISILSADKWLTSEKKLNDFLSSKVIITAKSDGVKLTLLKISESGNALKDYVVSYKGNVLYPGEYEFATKSHIKRSSIGASQFQVVFDHLEKIKNDRIPVGTELFIEFLIRKPTLSSNYTKHHGMILIAHTTSSYDEKALKFGKLKTRPGSFSQTRSEEFAKNLKLATPAVLFEGVLGTPSLFERSIKDQDLKAIYAKNKNIIQWSNPQILVGQLKEMFLEVPSKWGGKEEGVVIENLQTGVKLKWQQSYQTDQEARREIKAKYRGDEESESQYWKNVRSDSLELLRGVVIKSRPLSQISADIALVLKRHKPDFSHPVKTPQQILDDIQLSMKSIAIKSMRGNNNALFIGKTRVLTIAHYNMIKKAMRLYDDVVICMVTSKETSATEDLRERMMRSAFPNAHIIKSSNGNIVRILEKSPVNINVVIAGSDRVQSYKDQLSRTPDVHVRETPRDDSSISATKVIEMIKSGDIENFEKNTPKEIHKFWDELVGVHGD